MFKTLTKEFFTWVNLMIPR